MQTRVKENFTNSALCNMNQRVRPYLTLFFIKELLLFLVHKVQEHYSFVIMTGQWHKALTSQSLKATFSKSRNFLKATFSKSRKLSVQKSLLLFVLASFLHHIIFKCSSTNQTTTLLLDICDHLCINRLTIQHKTSKSSFLHHPHSKLLLITTMCFFSIRRIVLKLYDGEGDTVENVDFEKYEQFQQAQ